VLDGPEQADFSTWLANNTHALAGQQQQVRDNERDTKTWAQALKGLPPEVASKVKAIGTDITEDQLKHLKRQYDLNPKQVQTIIKAVGTEETIHKVNGLWTIIEDGKKVRTDLNPWHQNLMLGMDAAIADVQPGAIHLRRTIGDEPGKARVDLGPFSSDLNSQLFREGGRAHSAGVGVGHSIQSGVMSGLTGLGGAVFGAVAAAIQNGINAAHSHGGGGGGGGGGNTTTPRTAGRGSASAVDGNYFGLGNNTLAQSGAALLASLVAGITKGKKPLDAVLDKVKSDVENKVNALTTCRTSTTRSPAGSAGCRSRSSRHRPPTTGPVTLDQLLAKSAAEKAKAGQCRR
jgi:hypothetical protein